jgi:glutamate 5-kinase
MVSLTTDRSAAVRGARRVVVKIGSSSLTDTDGALDRDRLREISDAVAGRVMAGADVVVVSSGAIAAALTTLGLASRPRDLATQQAAASVGQGRLMAEYSTAFGRHGLTVGQVLLTVDDMTRRAHYRNAYRTFERLLALEVVPIVNENDTVATHEIRFGDNDRLASLVAHLVHAEVMVLLTDVEGLFDGPPDSPSSTMLREVRSTADLDGVPLGKAGSHIGSGGMASKVQAAQIATESGVGVVLTSAGQVEGALSGEDVGTWFPPRAKRRTTRLLWLEHATTPLGRLTLDDGAVRAVLRQNRSLLAAGICGVSGDFAAGDPVDLTDAAGRVVARGVVNFSSRELPRLLGRSTRELAAELGAQYEREVVHRDDLVVLATPSQESRP